MGVTIWFTGLSGAGKTTISRSLDEKLKEIGIRPEILDGDVIRTHLSKGLGFSKEDREENLKRIAFVCKLLTRNDAYVVACTISPYQSIRDYCRKEIGDFVEVHVNCPLDICEERDPKGLYKMVREGKIKNFTGIDDPYEPPKNAEIVIDSHLCTPEQAAEKIIDKLKEKGYI